MSEWRDIQGFEGRYIISTEGEVFSFKKKILLKHGFTCGYPMVSLWKDNVGKSYRIHRLILTAFVANTEDKKHINHKDGNKKNSVLSNLEWATASENQLHSLRVLKRRIAKGEIHGKAKLTNSNIFTIREMIADGVNNNVIAKQFGVTNQSISSIKCNQTWTHI